MNLLSSADGACSAWLKMTLAAAKQWRDSIKHCWNRNSSAQHGREQPQRCPQLGWAPHRPETTELRLCRTFLCTPGEKTLFFYICYWILRFPTSHLLSSTATIASLAFSIRYTHREHFHSSDLCCYRFLAVKEVMSCGKDRVTGC